MGQVHGGTLGWEVCEDCGTQARPRPAVQCRQCRSPTHVGTIRNAHPTLNPNESAHVM